ncbi:hypothetical protein [Pontixanthobacter sp.]|uniref:hypothetical protein n=1 Tax=Pontixanthobacter sp. TaxID=2792078 RepID=UPI003C7C7A42
MIQRLLVLLCTAFALSGCDALADSTPDYRYRLTVEVETPDGLKTGSSVIEVQTSIAGEYSIPTPGRVSQRLRGEAVAVDVGDGQTLFALLRSESEVDWAKQVMFLLTPSVRSSDGKNYEATFEDMLKRTREIELPRYYRNRGHIRNRKAYPMLVTFGDLSDPTSVAQVDPDDLAASFGDGTSLKRITVQMTDAPVTTGIAQRLGWFRKQAQSGGGLIPMIENSNGRYEAAPGYDESLTDIGLSNFSTEAYKL